MPTNEIDLGDGWTLNSHGQDARDGWSVSDPCGYFIDANLHAGEVIARALRARDERIAALEAELREARLGGACRLAVELGYATGHADTYEELIAHVREQVREARPLSKERAERIARLFVPDVVWGTMDTAARNDCIDAILAADEGE